MSVINRYVITVDNNGVSPTGFSKGDAPTILRKVADQFGSSAQGGNSSNLKIAHSPVAAVGKLTCTGNGTAGDTIVIGNVTLTVVASGATGNQVNVGASPSAFATNIGAKINSSSSFIGMVTASVVGAVVTITAYIPGTIGNGLQLSESSTSITLTQAFTGGSEGTAATFSSGL